jgi:hypothetical protein
MISTRISMTIWLGIGIEAGMGVAAPNLSRDAIRIDSTSSRFALEKFAFEVNSQTGQAEIRLNYDYPPYRLFGDETYRDPGPRTAIVPGLVYDSITHAVIYQSGTKRTTCAVVTDHQGLISKRPHLRNTGACAVTAQVNHHVESNGSATSRFDTLDTYFEVRER